MELINKYMNTIAVDYSTLDSLMVVVEKIHNNHYKNDIEGRDIFYTLRILLGGGYIFQDNIKYEKLEFTKGNLLKRINLFLEKKYEISN